MRDWSRCSSAKTTRFDVAKVVRSTNPATTRRRSRSRRARRTKPAIARRQAGRRVLRLSARRSAAIRRRRPDPSAVVRRDREVRDGKYDDAKGKLQAYLADHPTDTQAYRCSASPTRSPRCGRGDRRRSTGRARSPEVRGASRRKRTSNVRKSCCWPTRSSARSSRPPARAIEVEPQQPGRVLSARQSPTERQNDAAAIADLEKARVDGGRGQTRRQIAGAHRVYWSCDRATRRGTSARRPTSAKEVAHVDARSRRSSTSTPT